MLGKRESMGLEEQQFAVSKSQTVGLGEYLGTQLSEAFRQTSTGVSIQELREQVAGLGQGLRALDPTISDEERAQELRGLAMTETEWKESEYYRPGITWTGGSVAEARVKAEAHDDIKAKQEIIQHKPEGMVATALGFGAALIGSIPDPINFIPFGTVVRGGKAAHVIGRAMLEGAAGNVAVSAITRPYWEERGEESDWQDYALDAVMGAAIGGAFGVGGAAVRAIRGKATAASRSTIANGVEAVMAGESPANVQGLADAVNEARTSAGLAPDTARIVPEPAKAALEAVEPIARTVEDPDGLLGFVDQKVVDEIYAAPRERFSQADRAMLDDAAAATEIADKTAEAYARAVECII